MLDRVAVGDLPAKHHVALRAPGGALRHEECLTRAGFDGAYSILYHQHRPHELEPIAERRQPARLLRGEISERAPLRRRHFRTQDVDVRASFLDGRTPLLFSDDVALLTLKPSAGDPVYFVNADADELFFVRGGQGTVRSVFGDLRFASGDYVCVPKGVLHRILWDGPSGDVLSIQANGVGVPKQFRNEVGQLRMDAPYCHRDFRRPDFDGPRDESISEIVVQRQGRFHGFRAKHPPLDVVGWDGTVYPWAFPILAFQPRVSSVHLPPTWHGTFAAEGILVCSFVPRPLDFGPDSVPCPYPHSSVDIDEVIYYVSGDFSSRSGVGPGSVTVHPRGVPHGPHPGRYEGSIGRAHTDELAVMLDCKKPLGATPEAESVEDPSYDASFNTASPGGL